MNPYILIEGKIIKKKPNINSLNSLGKNAELTGWQWAINQTSDKEGNIAFFKSDFEKIKLKDDFSMHCGVYEVGDDVIYFIPNEITKKYFEVQLSEEIYYKTKEEIKEQLERMKEHPMYCEFAKKVYIVVKKASANGEKYKNGSILIKKPSEIMLNNDSFYSVYWVYRDTCCGHRCSGCQMFYFPKHSVDAILEFD